MAEIGGSVVGFADIAKMRGPDDKVAQIIEKLSETNEILTDGMVKEGNLTTGNLTVQRTSLPSGTYRAYNEGVGREKSTAKQIIDTSAMLESYSFVDKGLVDRETNKADFRFNEDLAFLEGMNQTQAASTFYANSNLNPRNFLGLAPRLNDLSASNRVLDGGGVGSDNTSVYLVVWGENKVHFIYPKLSDMGFQINDMGERLVQDANNKDYTAYVTHYKWDLGLAVKDERYMARLCNIDVSDLTIDASAGADLITGMTQMLERVYSLKGGRPAFYCNRTIREFLRLQINNANNVRLTVDQVGGEEVMRFSGVPVRMCEQILDTETVVS